MILKVCKNLSDFHKDNVVIEIYDLTNYKFELADSRHSVYIEIRNIEGKFNDWHYSQYGRYPVGNPKQEKKQAGPSDQFKNLFQII